MRKYVLLEGTYHNPKATTVFDRGNLGDRWITLNTAETDNKQVGDQVDYAKVAEGQRLLYGRSFTDSED